MFGQHSRNIIWDGSIGLRGSSLSRPAMAMTSLLVALLFFLVGGLRAIVVDVPGPEVDEDSHLRMRVAFSRSKEEVVGENRAELAFLVKWGGCSGSIIAKGMCLVITLKSRQTLDRLAFL